MGKRFTEYSQFDLSQVNKDVLKKWDENQVFAKSMTERDGCPSFVFFEGPPSANGMPCIHHVMARTIKDIFCRYKTMKGYQVKRKAGWDTHGLPVELSVEKALGITKEDIGKKISVADYNAACRKDVMKYTKEWEAYLGVWVCGLENDVYFQIGLVMLVGLAAKNAILIVEFAKVQVDKGEDLVQSAIYAAKLRFRPILMTSLAFVLGMLPMVLASGPGSASRQAIGTGVFFGMIFAIVFGIILVPFFFVMVYKTKSKILKHKKS